MLAQPKPASAHLVVVGRGVSAEPILTNWLLRVGIATIDQVWLRAAPRIGIEMIRNFQRELLLQPLAGSIRVGLIPEAHLLQIEAGHALLKLLEDPPDHAMIILGVEQEDQILPTILSRCQRWHIPRGDKKTTIGNQKDSRIEIEKLRRMSYRERLKLAEIWAKEEDWPNYLHELILSAQTLLRRGELSAESVARLLHYENLLSTNVTPRLLLENCLLALSKAAQ